MALSSFITINNKFTIFCSGQRDRRWLVSRGGTTASIWFLPTISLHKNEETFQDSQIVHMYADILENKLPEITWSWVTIYLLPNCEWNVLILDHMSNLALHCRRKKNNPIEKKNRPKDRDIKHWKEGHHKAYSESFSKRVPKMVPIQTNISLSKPSNWTLQ